MAAAAAVARSSWIVRIQRYGLVVAALASLLLGLWLENRSGGGEEGGIGSEQARGLPFRGQFPVARIDTPTFESKVGLPPLVVEEERRDYAVMLLLNTLAPEYGCPSCKVLDAEFKRLARTIAPSVRRERGIHFVVMELKENRDLFVRMKVEHVPALYFLPATTKHSRQEYLQHIQLCDLRRGMSAEVLAEFVEETTGLQSALLRTSRISHLFFAAAALLLTVAGCQRTVGLHRALGFFYFSKLWALLSMGFVLVMCSGLMWVRIRSAPYLALARDGSAQYVANALQSQLGVETHLVALLNGAAAIAVITLASKAPAISSPIASRIATVVCLAVILTVLAVELQVFRQKMHPYPFYLLFK